MLLTLQIILSLWCLFSHCLSFLGISSNGFTEIFVVGATTVDPSGYKSSVGEGGSSGSSSNSSIPWGKDVGDQSQKRANITETSKNAIRSAIDATFYSYDGSNNNLDHPLWGAKDEGRIRSFVPLNAYLDGIEAPMGAPHLPSPSRVMTELFNRRTPPNVTQTRNKNRPNFQKLSQFLPYFGEFLARDISSSVDNSSDPMPISCKQKSSSSSSSSEIFNSFCPPGRSSQPFYRSQYTHGTDRDNPRVPVNTKSAFLDLSNIYGHDENTVQSLRTNVGGEMALSKNGLPLRDPETGNLVTEDSKTRLHPGLLSLAVIFLRYHNMLAQRFAEAYPHADDELLFQLARMENIAVYQNIIEEKYVPLLLGDTLDPYTGYNETVNPTIDVFFTTVAFRYGHSAISGFYRVLDANYQSIPDYDPMLLRDVFNNTERLLDELAHITTTSNENDGNISGLEPLLRGLSVESERDIDVSFVPDINAFTSMVSVRNIQRGRDHGIPPYNNIRSWLDLPTFQSFEELVDEFGGKDVDPELVEILTSLYGTIDLMDAYVGALLETEFGYRQVGMVGPTMAMSIKEQFTRTRDGDRLWYKNRYSQETIAGFPSLSEIIKAIFPEEEMALFPADPFLRVGSDSNVDQNDQVCPDGGGTSSLSLLSGAYLAEWMIHDMDDDEDILWISLKLTVSEKIEGGFIGFGWGGHFMHNSIIWFCTDDSSRDRDYLPTCNDDEGMTFDMSRTPLFSCCAVQGKNHEPPRCDDNDGVDYRVEVKGECFSESSTSVTVSAPVCSSSYFVTAANSSNGDNDNQEVDAGVDAGDCFRIHGTMDFIAAYNPSSVVRPHASNQRSFGTIDFSRMGIITESVSQNPNDGLYALHGITMLGCWFILAPAAVFVVRYMKHRAWHLFVHVSLMTACGSVTYPLMIGALVTAIERQGSMHRWVGVAIVALFPFISGAGALRQAYLEGLVVLGKFDRSVWVFHRITGWSMLVLTFYNCYLGLIRIGPQDSYIEFLSVNSTPLGYDFPIFEFIQRYLFWPYVAILLATFGTAEFYWRYAKSSYYKSTREIWNDGDSTEYLDTMTTEEFNESTHYGKQLCIVDGYVLDIGEFMNEHPGGKRVMRFVAGTDITLELLGERSVDGMYHAHSPFAFGRLKSLRIARLEESPESNGLAGLKGKNSELYSSNNTSQYQDEHSSVASGDSTSTSGENKKMRFFFRRKGHLASTESERASIFVKAHVESFKKVTPHVTTPDKPVIQLFLLVPHVSGEWGSNSDNFTGRAEGSFTAAPGSVCVLRARDSRGDIIQRSQTPVSVKHLTNGDIIYEFFISMVPGGKMSTALRRMKQGSSLLLRRPSVVDNLTRRINSKVWRCVVLIAAGTGLSPILQVIDHLLFKHSKATSKQTGTFSANRSQIFLVWHIHDSHHNYMDFCGIKERVKLSKGALKWVIIRSKSSDSNNQGSNDVRQSERTAKQSQWAAVSNDARTRGDCKGTLQQTIKKRTKLLFGEKTRIGDVCDEIMCSISTGDHSISVSEPYGEDEPLFGVGTSLWKGGYLNGQLDSNLLSNIVATAYSGCALRSRSRSIHNVLDAELEGIEEVDEVEDVEEGKAMETLRSRTVSNFNLSESLMEDDLPAVSSSSSSSSSRKKLAFAETGRKETTLKSDSTFLDDIGKYDDLLVALSGRPKFEDDCLDYLLQSGVKEDQIIRFTDFHG